MDQIVQDEQSVEERSYRKNRRKALILWGVLAIITITVTMLVPKVEMAYLIAQGATDIVGRPWHKWIVAGIIAVVTFLVPYHRIYNWLKKVFRDHIRSVCYKCRSGMLWSFPASGAILWSGKSMGYCTVSRDSDGDIR